MSVYNAYVGHGAAAPYYSQPPQPPQPFPQQYQGYYPQQTYDENGFRNLYMQRLGALTVNSRPIIQALSMLAQDNPHMARVVVECIENQINLVSFLFLTGWRPERIVYSLCLYINFHNFCSSELRQRDCIWTGRSQLHERLSCAM
jgi:hypothetical protein